MPEKIKEKERSKETKRKSEEEKLRLNKRRYKNIKGIRHGAQ